MSDVEWIVSSGRLGFSTNDFSDEHRDHVISEFRNLVKHLNDTVEGLAVETGATKQQVFEVLQSLNPPRVSHSAEMGLPWCEGTANPGDPAPNCGQPPMQPGIPPCCMDWWPGDCSPAGRAQYPYWPRPSCQSALYKWGVTRTFPGYGDVYGWLIDQGAYGTGLQVYADWVRDFDAKIDAARKRLTTASGDVTDNGRHGPAMNGGPSSGSFLPLVLAVLGVGALVWWAA